MTSFLPAFIGVSIPFLGTTLGSAMVFFMKKSISIKVEKFLLGFTSGVMIAASVWSLLLPSLEISSNNYLPWFPASFGFLLGIFFLLFLDSIIPHLHLDSDTPEGIHSNFKKNTMLILAITMHNIPEGMAVGVAFAGALFGNNTLSILGATTLSLGIAIQNFPEGAIISMPLKSNGNMSSGKAFICGVLSGVVEPIAALVTILLTSFVVPILPYLLSFAAGAMFYVVVEELIPETQMGKHSNIGTIGLAIGFVLMMILDVAL